MKKTSFLAIATIFLTMATMPAKCMESESSSLTTEIPTISVKLYLRKVLQSENNDSWNKLFNKEDEHACKVLGIQWDKNTNNYWVDKALYRRPGDTKDFCDWTNCPHPQGLPLTTIPNPSLIEGAQYSLKAPSSFPASFVQELQEKKSITLENGKFETPVKIIFELGSIRNTSNTNNQ